MHILLIYMYYLRPGDHGIKRFNEFCPMWLGPEHNRVTVLTGQIRHNTGRVYEDLAGRGVVVEEVDGIQIHRIPGPDTYFRGFVGRAHSQMQWAKNVCRYLPDIDAPDIALAVSPHLWHAWPLVAAKKKFNVPTVLELADIWPEVIVKMRIAPAWHPGIQYLARLEKWAYQNADHLVTTVESQRQHIIQRGLKSAEDVTAIYHGARLEEYNNVPEGMRNKIRTRLGIAEDQVLVVYAGSHGPSYGLAKMVDLAEALKAYPKVRIVSIGEGTQREKLAEDARRRSLDNIIFFGPVPGSEVSNFLSAADIACSFTSPNAVAGWNEETTGSFRSSMFDYAAARLPLVFNEKGFPIREIQDRAQAGLYADTSNGVLQTTQHIILLAENPAERRRMGENNYNEIAVRYSRDKMSAKYMEIMSSLVS